ncbi:hypothetical protein B0H14DRAFT_3459406 [Mycena olivaceomarginata]|nr:hypothetical protein B0H14DRAFT_3459406 [Mycena olivaceomarginata]
MGNCAPLSFFISLKLRINPHRYKKHVQRLSQKEIEAEAELMMALAEAERQADEDELEDAQPDDGAVEIPSEEEYVE